MKIGVFICHCGSNIAGTVDCGKVAEIAKTYPDVAFSTDTMYTCSEPGQEEIVAAIKEHKLDGVVVASCTPRMHEPTFRRTVERAGLNKYMFEMANIREHVSWIGKDKEANTNKAAELVRIAVEKLRRDNPLFSKSFESTKRVLVIGGGVATVYENIMHLPEMANAGAASASGEGQKSNADVKAEARSKARGKVAWLDSFFEYLSDSFRPILGVLLGASIIIALVNLLISLNVIPNDEVSAGWVFVKAIWKGVFYFLPIMVAYNASKKLKVDPWLGGAIMAMLMTRSSPA